MNEHAEQVRAMAAMVFCVFGPAGCATTSHSPVVQATPRNAPAECTSVASDLVGWLAETDLVPARDLITPDISNERLIALAAILSAMGEYKSLSVTNSTTGVAMGGSTSWILTTIATFGNNEKAIEFTVVRDKAGVYKVKNLTIR